LSLRAVGKGMFPPDVSIGCIAADGRVTVDPTAVLLQFPECAIGYQARMGRCRGNLQSDEHISERVIFPITESQSNGIEDARFVEFDEGGRRTFYATYTAYSGKAIRSS